jgi:hypothetical protein
MATGAQNWSDDYEKYGAEDARYPDETKRKLMRGTMLWFNEEKDLGLILTEEGERLPVRGSGFAGGLRPKGRCARAVVAYEVLETQGAAEANEVVLVPDEDFPRARRRHASGVR